MTPARVIAIAALALLASAAALTRADPDLWGHVRFGVDILETRELPTRDPYSFTQDRPWINHEWLSELFMGAAWQAGGTGGLTALKAILALAVLLIVWHVYRAADLGWRMAAVAAAVVAGAQLTQTLRPQLWSLVGIALLAARLQSAGSRRPWIYAALFCLWANAHGGWIVGLGVLSVWAASESVRDRARLPGWTLAVAASVAGTLATPYGWRLSAFMLDTVRLTRPQIEDWSPLWDVDPAKWVLWTLIAAWSLWLWTKLPRSRLATGLVLLALAAASVQVVRIVPLFGVASVVLLAPAMTAWRPRRALRPLHPGEERTAAALIAAACAVLAVFVGASSFRCINARDDRMPDRAAVHALSQAPPGRLVTFFNWGEYAIWHLGPAIRVSMDGRRETVYSEARLDEHDAILFGTPEGLQTLAAWQPEYVWLPASSVVTRDWLSANGYRIDVGTGSSFVAVRADLARLTQAGEPLSGSRCFPD